MKTKEQLSFTYPIDKLQIKLSYKDKLVDLLNRNLDFHNQHSNYSSHNFHSFPAKFPPQLPKMFIDELTEPNEIVLDPMVGSGTTIVEAYLANRKGIGLDIDPLSLKISKIKTTPVNPEKIIESAKLIYRNSKNDLENNIVFLESFLENYFDSKTKEFVDYWFLPEIQLELIALLNQISKIDDILIKNFFQVTFSSIIITKTGGVSLALDLAHTRPHKARIIIDKKNTIRYGKEFLDSDSKRKSYLTKALRSPLDEFWKKVTQNLKSIVNYNPQRIEPDIKFCDSQNLSLNDKSVDLIITSPPYASNAIDYMRAHKFSLIWLGHNIDELTIKRKQYIGGELVSNFLFEELPPFSLKKVNEISVLDSKRGFVLKRYYSEMSRVLKEMYRVLKPNKAAIVVVGNSVMKGIETETHKCLAEIGENIGFLVPHIGVRNLDRNKRMLPAGYKTDLNSQIQQRMHKEYIIGFYKPE